MCFCRSLYLLGIHYPANFTTALHKIILSGMFSSLEHFKCIIHSILSGRYFNYPWWHLLVKDYYAGVDLLVKYSVDRLIRQFIQSKLQMISNIEFQAQILRLIEPQLCLNQFLVTINQLANTFNLILPIRSVLFPAFFHHSANQQHWKLIETKLSR